ncbi:hypothetical protein LWI28_007493 [Acer negundo]|uniref:Uncharacterized protein n=1 Tax=Acer negundo TaxID=4023 RepID=A0AAD5I9H5_ACENE|nr:hypothetical protein LWI28_007493 [Acer negundo]
MLTSAALISGAMFKTLKLKFKLDNFTLGFEGFEKSFCVLEFHSTTKSALCKYKQLGSEFLVLRWPGFQDLVALVLKRRMW